MNQAELQSSLAQYHYTMHSFYAECKQDPIVAADIDMEALKHSMFNADKLIEEITDDVMNNLVPASFYEHLQHDIEKYLPAKVPTVFRLGVSKTLAYKTIADQIIDINGLCKTYSFYKNWALRRKILF